MNNLEKENEQLKKKLEECTAIMRRKAKRISNMKKLVKWLLEDIVSERRPEINRYKISQLLEISEYATNDDKKDNKFNS